MPIPPALRMVLDTLAAIAESGHCAVVIDSPREPTTEELSAIQAMLDGPPNARKARWPTGPSEQRRPVLVSLEKPIPFSLDENHRG